MYGQVRIWFWVLCSVPRISIHGVARNCGRFNYGWSFGGSIPWVFIPMQTSQDQFLGMQRRRILDRIIWGIGALKLRKPGAVQLNVPGQHMFFSMNSFVFRFWAQETFGPTSWAISNHCPKAFQWSRLDLSWPKYHDCGCWSFFFLVDSGVAKEAVILAKWLMGVTMGLAEQQPDNTHHQPGPCLQHTDRIISSGLLQSVFKATGGRFHQRMCNAGCCDITAGANLETTKFAETSNCKLFVAQLFELNLDVHRSAFEFGFWFRDP